MAGLNITKENYKIRIKVEISNKKFRHQKYILMVFLMSIIVLFI